MATVLKKNDIEWDTPTSRRRFPWDEWTDGQTYQAVQGEDFQSGPHAFTAQLRKRAETLGLEVKTSVEKNMGDKSAVVFFQFVK